jgi:uncharacterized protein (DUF885 family)
MERQSTPYWSRDWQLGAIRLANKGLAGLRRFDRSRRNDVQRVSADLMESHLDLLVREAAFLDYEFPLQQMNGANVGLVQLLTVVHPPKTERDAENYNAVLGQMGMRMDEAIALSVRQAAKNIVPPRFILEATIRQMQRFADSSPAQNPLVTTLAQKLTAIQDLPEASRTALLADAARIVGTEVYPAWKRAIFKLQSQLPRSTDNAGLWAYKGGPEAYEFFLESSTTTKLKPQEIHQIGLEQVSTIETQMDRLFRGSGRTSGSVKERQKSCTPTCNIRIPRRKPAGSRSCATSRAFYATPKSARRCCSICARKRRLWCKLFRLFARTMRRPAIIVPRPTGPVPAPSSIRAV